MNSTTFRKGQTPWNKGKKGLQKAWNKGIKGVQTAWNKGLPRSEETKRKLREVNLGKKLSLETRLKMKMSSHKGETNGNWKGGTTPLGKKIRASFEYKLWRTAVFTRDEWTCQTCRIKGGVILNAHHIKSFADFPELRFEVSNGITLCEDCHKETDTYLFKARVKR